MNNKRNRKPETGFSRPLGKAERFYWLYDFSSCTNFVVIAGFSGELPEENLRKALQSLREEHALLQTRVAVKPGERVVYEPAPDVPVPIETRSTGQNGWREETERQLNLRFPAGSFPLLRINLFPEPPPDRSVALFTFSHALTDAVAGIRLVRDALFLAGGGSREPVYHPPLPPQEKIYPREMSGAGAYLRLARTWGREIKDLFKNGKPEPVPGGAGQPSGSGRVLRILPHELDQGRTQLLIERCREQGTTVHGFLCAAQLLAVRGELPASRAATLAVSSAVNMRERLSSPVRKSDLGMYISMVPTTHRLRKDRDIWSLAREASRILQARIERGDPHLFWRFFPPDRLFPPEEKGARRLEKVMAAVPPMTIVTNLGPVEGEVGFDSFRVESLRFAMAPQTGCPLVTAANSSGGRLFLNSAFNLTVIKESQANRIMGRMRKSLELAARE